VRTDHLMGDVARGDNNEPIIKGIQSGTTMRVIYSASQVTWKVMETDGTRLVYMALERRTS
jgi:hypothetical protein